MPVSITATPTPEPSMPAECTRSAPMALLAVPRATGGVVAPSSQPGSTMLTTPLTRPMDVPNRLVVVPRRPPNSPADAGGDAEVASPADTTTAPIIRRRLLHLFSRTVVSEPRSAPGGQAQMRTIPTR